MPELLPGGLLQDSLHLVCQMLAVEYSLGYLLTFVTGGLQYVRMRKQLLQQPCQR